MSNDLTQQYRQWLNEMSGDIVQQHRDGYDKAPSKHDYVQRIVADHKNGKITDDQHKELAKHVLGDPDGPHGPASKHFNSIEKQQRAMAERALYRDNTKKQLNRIKTVTPW